MKHKVAQVFKWMAISSVVGALGPAALAQLNIPHADGTDGALIVSNNLVIDLGQAGSGAWTNASASPGKGTYDTRQWAVVFKYSSVTISNGATLSFLNHSSHAPVVWLVSGDVVINGVISLDGQAYNTDPVHLTEPGPGGFRGAGGPAYGNGSGFGPGGGRTGGGSYLGSYGNPQLLPLIGGSGGAGDGSQSGGAGGGAMLIAASGTITINGSCHANGGYEYLDPGSGGGIRLVGNQIQGNGTLQALPGDANGGAGIIRLEGNTVTNGLNLNPQTVAVTPPNPPVIFPSANAPTVTIVNVGGISAPSEPKAAMDSSGDDDVVLATTSAVTIQLQTINFPTNGVVNVFIKPRNAVQTILQATFDGGTTNLANWHVSTVLNSAVNQGHTVIQARAVY